jgi:nitrogenase molybdenum-iron protein beta chain
MSSVIEQVRYTCALGAQQTVLSIPGVLPIVHAGPGCSSKITKFAELAGRQGCGYAGGPEISCTNSCEQEVVFGGEGKLRNTINGALKVMKGDLFVVLSGCTADIVGDDTVSVAKEFADEGYPVVGVETGGFKGNSYYGHEITINAIIEQFVGDVKPNPRKGMVNVFSIVPYQNPFWRGDLEALKNLLETLGLEVHILFGYSSQGIAEWKDLPNAQFNLLISPWVGLGTVNLLEKKYGTPFLHYPILPVGAQETNTFLRDIGDYAGISKFNIEKLIEREEDRYYKYLIDVSDFFTVYRGNIPSELYTVADSSYGISLSSFLTNEMGMILKGLYLTDDPPKTHIDGVRNAALLKSETFRDRIVFETDGGLIQRSIKEKLNKYSKSLFLGSGWEKFLAQETGNHYTFVSLPLPETVIINKTFLGYDGGLSLVEEIYSDLFKSKSLISKGSVVRQTEDENNEFVCTL